MGVNGIIGREYEQKLIQERCESSKAELIAIYGRRRVGKTFLVRKMFNDQFAFSFIGMYEVERAVQLEQFRMALEQYSKQAVPRLKTWFEAFAALREYLSGISQQDPIVLFFDELPWMDTPKSNFIAAFSFFLEFMGFYDSQSQTDRVWFFHHVDAIKIHRRQREDCTVA